LLRLDWLQTKDGPWQVFFFSHNFLLGIEKQFTKTGSTAVDPTSKIQQSSQPKCCLQFQNLVTLENIIKKIII
jgi:hypothetical protein